LFLPFKARITYTLAEKEFFNAVTFTPESKTSIDKAKAFLLENFLSKFPLRKATATKDNVWKALLVRKPKPVEFPPAQPRRAPRSTAEVLGDNSSTRPSESAEGRASLGSAAFKRWLEARKAAGKPIAVEAITETDLKDFCFFCTTAEARAIGVGKAPGMQLIS
jgi:hypothetical protein